MISHIEPLWLRRIIVMVSYPIIMLLGVFYGARLGIGEVLADIHRAAVRAWSDK